jgi:hypothetical protein
MLSGFLQPQQRQRLCREIAALPTSRVALFAVPQDWGAHSEEGFLFVLLLILLSSLDLNIYLV